MCLFMFCRVVGGSEVLRSASMHTQHKEEASLYHSLFLHLYITSVPGLASGSKRYESVLSGLAAGSKRFEPVLTGSHEANFSANLAEPEP